MNNQHKSIAFTSETEEKSILSFLDVKISSENKTFITSVCLKPIFTGAFTKLNVLSLNLINTVSSLTYII